MLTKKSAASRHENRETVEVLLLVLSSPGQTIATVQRNISQHVATYCNKAIGFENISARILKDSASVITESLTKLFNQSFVTRTLPSLWKSGKVSAIFKKDCDPNNYRPINVLQVVHNQLYYFLNVNKIITSEQFGFRPKLSIAHLPQLATNLELDAFPVTEEVSKTIKQMTSGKGPGPRAIPAEMFKTADGESIRNQLTSLSV